MASKTSKKTTITTASTTGGTSASSATSATATTGHSEQVSSSERPVSPLSPSRLTRLQEKNELQHLNDRLANYIDRVRHLEIENNRLSVQVQTSHETVQREVVSIKHLYEKELSDTRRLLDDTAKDKARLQIEANKLQVENDEITNKLTKKDKELSSAEKRITNLENNVEELRSRLNQALSERKKIEEELKEANSEIDTLDKQLATIKKQLQDETLRRVDAENRIQSLKEEIQFKQTVHEKEIEETRIIQETEISEIVNEQLREQYEQKLADELKELREENEGQLRLNREDMERKFENQISDLQNAMDEKNASISTIRNELQQLKSKHETMTSKQNQLETINHSLQNRIKDLERLIEQEREWKDNAIQAKDDQINQLREEIKNIMNEYQDLLDIKIALDMEISAYRKLLEGEESRLNLSTQQSPTASTSTGRVVSPRTFTPRGAKRKRTIYLQEEENVVDIVVNSNAKSDVEINDQDQDGKYVKLFNKGDKEISLSGWQLLRTAATHETHFKFHRSIIIKPNSYVTVWSSDTNAVHSPPTDIVMKGQTWFTADTMTTILINNNGEEMATRKTSKRLSSTSSQRSSEGFSAAHQQVDVRGSATAAQDRCSIM